MPEPTAPDLLTSLRRAGEELAKQINDATELTVETKFVVIDEDGSVDWSKVVPIARTTVKLDGDTELIVPLSRQGDNLVVRKDLLELHDSNVANARAYREKLYDMIVGVAHEITGR
jgi:hypothetical protein